MGCICFVFCEIVCVLGINQLLVVIEYIEKFIVEVVFEKGYVCLQLFILRIGKKVVIVGLGLVGLVVVVQLNKVGYLVMVFECNDCIGGLLCYGIFDFKLEKFVVEWWVVFMEVEGIWFCINVNVGGNVDLQELMD